MLPWTAQSLPGYVVWDCDTVLVQKPTHLKLKVPQLVPDFQDVELMLYLVVRSRLNFEHLFEFPIFDTTNAQVCEKTRRFKLLQGV